MRNLELTTKSQTTVKDTARYSTCIAFTTHTHTHTVPQSNDCCCLQALAKDYGLDSGMTDAGKIAVGAAVGVGVTAVAAAGLYLLFGGSKEKKGDR